jgi:hypothetical protein
LFTCSSANGLYARFVSRPLRICVPGGVYHLIAPVCETPLPNLPSGKRIPPGTY